MKRKSKKEKKYYGFHIISHWNTLRGKPILANAHSGKFVEVNQTASVVGNIKLCGNGLHFSDTLVDAQSYVRICKGAWICYVEAWGDVRGGADRTKRCARNRRVLSMEQSDRELINCDGNEFKAIEDRLRANAIRSILRKHKPTKNTQDVKQIAQSIFHGNVRVKHLPPTIRKKVLAFAKKYYDAYFFRHYFSMKRR